MEITGRHTYQADFATTWGVLADPATMCQRYEGLGHRDVRILRTEGDTTSDEVLVEVHRVVDIDLPEIAKKALKPTAVCIQTDRWRALPDGSREGDIRVETKGQPAEITGRTRLRPGADGTTEFEVTLELKVKVPIIGGKIANMMRGDAEKLMQDEFICNDRRIAEVTGAG